MLISARGANVAAEPITWGAMILGISDAAMASVRGFTCPEVLLRLEGGDNSRNFEVVVEGCLNSESHSLPGRRQEVLRIRPSRTSLGEGRYSRNSGLPTSRSNVQTTAVAAKATSLCDSKRMAKTNSTNSSGVNPSAETRKLGTGYHSLTIRCQQ
jgi:hypothetical protein